MENTSSIKEICPSTTLEWVKKGALLVDVREKPELEELAYDVPHILHIPLTEFESRFHEIPMNQDVVVVCKSGGRSLRATAFLMHHGYSNVVNMQHGMMRWVEKGFPTKGTQPNNQMRGGDCCTSEGCC